MLQLYFQTFHDFDKFLIKFLRGILWKHAHTDAPAFSLLCVPVGFLSKDCFPPNLDNFNIRSIGQEPLLLLSVPGECADVPANLVTVIELDVDLDKHWLILIRLDVVKGEFHGSIFAQ